MPQAAFVVALEVSDINLESLTSNAAALQDACEAAGFEVLYVHPYQRRADEAPSQPFAAQQQASPGGLPA